MSTPYTHSFYFRALITPSMLLPRNPNRSSYFILNQHPTQDIYIGYGSSSGPHVATAGNHMGIRIAANGGFIRMPDDPQEIWIIAANVTDRILVEETVSRGRLVKETK